MTAQTALTLVPTAIAVIIAVVVPWFTFRLALRQDRLRRLHDQRAQLYVDLLTEAHAELKYFEIDIEDDDTRKRMAAHQVDLRLPPMERARLGSRGTIFASRTVNRLFNALQSRALLTTLTRRPNDEPSRTAARMHVGEAFDALEAAVRQEMGADQTEPKR